MHLEFSRGLCVKYSLCSGSKMERNFDLQRGPQDATECAVSFHNRVYALLLNECNECITKDAYQHVFYHDTKT